VSENWRNKAAGKVTLTTGSEFLVAFERELDESGAAVWVQQAPQFGTVELTELPGGERLSAVKLFDALRGPLGVKDED
jgi:hypothetical protein